MRRAWPARYRISRNSLFERVFLFLSLSLSLSLSIHRSICRFDKSYYQSLLSLLLSVQIRGTDRSNEKKTIIRYFACFVFRSYVTREWKNRRVTGSNMKNTRKNFSHFDEEKNLESVNGETERSSRRTCFRNY